MIAKTIISTVLGLFRSGEASLIRWHLNRDHTHTYVYMYICVCYIYIHNNSVQERGSSGLYICSHMKVLGKEVIV